jgi:hypothetical protein
MRWLVGAGLRKSPQRATGRHESLSFITELIELIAESDDTLG